MDRFDIALLEALKSDSRRSMNELGEQSGEDNRLEGQQVSSTEYRMAAFTKRMTVDGLGLEVGDVVLREDHELGRIVACVQENADLMIIVEGATFLRHRSRNSNICISNWWFI